MQLVAARYLEAPGSFHQYAELEEPGLFKKNGGIALFGDKGYTIVDAAELIAEESANYLVRCHRTGFLVYSDTPTARICNTFLFSEWPRKLFEGMSAEYDAAVREI